MHDEEASEIVGREIKEALKNRLLEAGEKKLEKQEARIEELEKRDAEQQARIEEQEARIEELEQKARIEELEQEARKVTCLVCLEASSFVYITGCGHPVCGVCLPRLEERRMYSEPEAVRVNEFLGMMGRQGNRSLIKYGGAIRCPICMEASVCHRLYL